MRNHPTKMENGKTKEATKPIVLKEKKDKLASVTIKIEQYVEFSLMKSVNSKKDIEYFMDSEIVKQHKEHSKKILKEALKRDLNKHFKFELEVMHSIIDEKFEQILKKVLEYKQSVFCPKKIIKYKQKQDKPITYFAKQDNPITYFAKLRNSNNEIFLERIALAENETKALSETKSRTINGEEQVEKLSFINPADILD